MCACRGTKQLHIVAGIVNANSKRAVELHVAVDVYSIEVRRAVNVCVARHVKRACVEFSGQRDIAEAGDVLVRVNNDTLGCGDRASGHAIQHVEFSSGCCDRRAADHQLVFYDVD